MYFPLSERNGWGKRPVMKAEDDLFRGSLTVSKIFSHSPTVWRGLRLYANHAGGDPAGLPPLSE